MKKYNQAINLVLQRLGEPLLSIEDGIDGIFEAEQADFLIEDVKEEVLSKGWNVNTDDEWPLYKDNNNYIVVPSGVLKLDATDGNYIVKDGKLYDKDNRTYKFNDVDSINCEIVWDLDFDDLPKNFQKYIALKAARLAVQTLNGETAQLNILMRDEQEAKFQMEQEELEGSDYNIFDNSSVSRIVDRGSNPSSTV